MKKLITLLLILLPMLLVQAQAPVSLATQQRLIDSTREATLKQFSQQQLIDSTREATAKSVLENNNITAFAREIATQANRNIDRMITAIFWVFSALGILVAVAGVILKTA